MKATESIGGQKHLMVWVTYNTVSLLWGVAGPLTSLVENKSYTDDSHMQ